MLVSVSWLKKYVPIQQETKKLSDDLTMAGLNVEHVYRYGLDDPSVVVGHVLEVRKHPDAQRLSVCRVRVDSGEPKEIVCGAPNVAAGQAVLVALPGAVLPDGMKIRAAKIRGVRSNGMICSARELGIGEDASGILVLEDRPAPGTSIAEVIGGDEILEVEVTPNRPDLLCHVGVAREIAALYHLEVTVPQGRRAADRRGADFSVAIGNGEDCPRYVGLRVSGIRVGSSPQWLRSALESVGINSVNNIVDVANFVMMEMGQPLHAFDFARLGGAQIVVRRAADGERLVALDGNVYDLTPSLLVIADAREPVALAGVMGGEASAVHEDTTEILIESANFQPVLVRACRKQLGLNTDAAYRFERGVDRARCREAAERAATLICEIAGGEMGPIVDAYPSPSAQRECTIRESHTRRILGSAVTPAEIEECLGALGFEVIGRGEDRIDVRIQTYRPDIVEEIDLIEEVARIYGYDRIGTAWRYRCTAYAEVDPYDRFLETACEHLVSRGFSEVITSSFTDGREIEDFAWAPEDPRRHPIAVRNPLSAFHRFLKTSHLPGLLGVIRRNMDQGLRDVSVYQVTSEFLAPRGSEELPEERRVLGIAMTRPLGQHFWYDPKLQPELFVIKKEIEILAARLGVDLRGVADYHFDIRRGAFRYARGGETLIEGGVLGDTVAERYDFEQPVWHATIAMRPLYERRQPRSKLKRLAEFPASKRDLSLVAGADVTFADIEKILVKSGGALLESLQVFDVYEGKGLGERQRAYGVRLQFRSVERTLTDADVEEIIARILRRLKNELDVTLRT